MAKKYYWLKLKEDFFTSKEIKKLRRIAGGDTYTIIYLKMQLLSIKTDGKIFFEGIEDSFAEEIALQLDESIDNVKITIMYLEKHGLIEQVNMDAYMIPQVLEIIGSESDSAERVRRYRESKLALQSNINLLQSNAGTLQSNNLLQGNTNSLQSNASLLQSNTSVTKCNTEIEIEIEIEKKKDSSCSNINTKLANFKQQQQSPEKIYMDNIGLLTPHIAERIVQILKDGVGEDLLCRYIIIAVERDKRNWAYIEKMAIGNLEKNIKTIEQYNAYCVEWSKKNSNKTYANKVPQYANFEQRKYEEKDFEKFYANLNPE